MNNNVLKKIRVSAGSFVLLIMLTACGGDGEVKSEKDLSGGLIGKWVLEYANKESGPLSCENFNPIEFLPGNKVIIKNGTHTGQYEIFISITDPQANSTTESNYSDFTHRIDFNFELDAELVYKFSDGKLVMHITHSYYGVECRFAKSTEP